jgi:hypothetical protein
MITAIQPMAQGQDKIPFTSNLKTWGIRRRVVKKAYISTLTIGPKKYVSVNFSAWKFMHNFKKKFKVLTKELPAKATLTHAKKADGSFGNNFILKLEDVGKELNMEIRASELFKFTNSGEPRVTNILHHVEIENFSAKAKK